MSCLDIRLAFADQHSLMQPHRRPHLRRRRVLVTQVVSDDETDARVSGSQLLKIREATHPSVAYGSKVRQCLRGRWFSLVPVSFTALLTWSIALVGITSLLVVMHDATLRWPTIAENTNWVNVLRITERGSLGRFITGLMYFVLAGAAWMIYQLRRYRNDDFRGHYRLWHWVRVVALAAALVTMVPVVEMVGSFLDWCLGKRVALSGADWLRLLLTVGGCVLAIQTIAEMWRYRVASLWLCLGWACMAMPVAANWNVIGLETPLRWIAVTSASLVAAMCWLLSATIYLRELYCEVRGIATQTRWWSQWHTEWQQHRQERKQEREEQRERRQQEKQAALDQKRADREAQIAAKAAAKEAAQAERAAKKAAKAEAKSKTADATETAKTDQQATADEATETTPQKRGWFSRKPKVKNEEETKDAPPQEVMTETDSGDDEAAPAEEATKKRRFGLGGFLKRKSADQDDDSSSEDESNQPTKRASPSASSNDDDNSDQPLSEDDIDWTSLSKSERRRLRKQLKRGNRAA